jgi:hypothetical protein
MGIIYLAPFKMQVTENKPILNSPQVLSLSIVFVTQGTFILDNHWLSSATFIPMATIVETKESETDIRVALIIETDKLKEVDRQWERIHIKQKFSKWPTSPEL